MSARVFISRDSGALCVGADEVARALFKAAEKRGLDVEIVRTGARGMYWLEPTIEVARPEGRVGYGPVKPADIDSLLDAGMLEGGKHPLSLGLVEDIPFFKRQTRLTFKNCGIVDPRSLEDYKAHGGYQGLAKAIGVSNYSVGQIDELKQATGVSPQVNQIRWGPSLYDPAMVSGLDERAVVLEGYSPFKVSNLHDPTLVSVAKRHDATTTQVIVAWHIAHGFVVIPKSVHRERIVANAAGARIQLTAEEVAAIDRLSRVANAGS